MSAPITSPETGHAALTGALNSSFRVLRWLMMLVAIFYVFSGVFIVGQHERAYVLVFGTIDGLAGKSGHRTVNPPPPAPSGPARMATH